MVASRARIARTTSSSTRVNPPDRRGDQPQHIFRALAELGKVVLKPDYSNLPAFDKYNAEEMYLSWNIELEADVSREQILEEFDWVETECSVEISERKIIEIEDYDRREGERREE